MIVLLAVLSSTIVHAQNKSRVPDLDPKIKNLKVGDKVPDILIAKIINNSARTAKISDFRDRLLILDFWDTYCGSCIEALPKLNAIQNKFGNRIKILPVTWQKEAEVIRFFKTNRHLKNQATPVLLPCVVEDRLLASYFRHQIISHEVWIYKGLVKAITSPEYVNEENIRMVLDGKLVDWPVKNDAVDFDISKPLMSLICPDEYNQKNKVFSYSVLAGHRNGLNKTGGLNFSYDSLNHTYRTALFNKSIASAYKLLLFNTDSVEKDFIMTPGRWVLEAKDPSKYDYDAKMGLYDAWSREHEVCYEMVTSRTVKKHEMARMVLKDLDNKLGLYGRWEKRKVKCLVFTRGNGPVTDTLSMDKGGIPVPIIAFFKLDNTGKYPPAVDETNFTGGLKMEPYDGTLEGLRKEMQRHGLNLIEAEREIDVMVITENDYKP